MTIHIQLTTSILCLFLSFQGFSQSISVNQLQGRWEVELAESDKKGMAMFLEDSVMEIFADSTFSGSLFGEKVKGIWAINDRIVTLTPQNNSSRMPDIVLNQIENDKCIWVFNEKLEVEITLIKKEALKKTPIEHSKFLPINKREVVGSWTNIKLRSTQSTTEKNNFLFGEATLSFPLVLKADGSFTMEKFLVNVSKLTSIEGTWSIENDLLVLTDQKNGIEAYGLIYLEGNQMILIDSQIQKTPLLGQDQLEYTFIR